MEHYESIRRLLDAVRRRWRALRFFEAALRVALAGLAIVGLALTASRFVQAVPAALVLVAATALLLLVAVSVKGFLPLCRVPDDVRMARYIEERTPELEDRLASAVDAARRREDAAALTGPMLRDAARQADAVDLERVVSRRSVRRAAAAAGSAGAVLLGLFIAAREPIGQAADAASMTLFPSRVALEVAPGSTRIMAGAALTIHARLVGNRSPVPLRVEIAADNGWRTVEMTPAAGGFELALPAIAESFKYRVSAGPVRSPAFDVSAVAPPRVERIDVEYVYPPSLGLAPRAEEDGGDIYAPHDTSVTLRIHVDRPAANGYLALADGRRVELRPEAPTTFAASLRVDGDSSYRVAVADADGFSDAGETEYFIRVLEDRPPEVRIVEPASDRPVTKLEEVDIEASADDDYGVESLELVYAVRGGAETVLPLGPMKPQPSVQGRRTLYLEDLDVEPGDFISYYVRARDVARGRRSSQTRSDMYFLEVQPFDQQFRLAESQAQAGGGSGVDDLVRAQKEILAATWKLDRRAPADGARSADDVRAVGRAEAELRTRVEQVASSFREQTMRDPRRRTPATPAAGEAGRAMPEESSMALASAAMARAIAALEALRTGSAIAPEMEALNHLLEAQTEVIERQISRQPSGSGNADNNRNLDLSSLFDRELRRQQQTNYENTSSTEPSDAGESMLDRIKALARRQDEIVKRQEELARQRAAGSVADAKRELEKLTREQTELRQDAEELSRQMGRGEPDRSGGPTGSSGREGAADPDGRSSAGQMRGISEAMRAAAGGLRSDDQAAAKAGADRALEALQRLAREVGRERGPDEARRALGEAQLEARQLADAQRRLASENRQASADAADPDSIRRLAGEQQRLADRANQLQERLDRQAAGRGRSESERSAQAAARAAVSGLVAGRVASRMRQSADDMRSAALGGAPDPRSQSARQEEIARSLDEVAADLAAAGGAGDQSQRLSAQRARARALRDRLEELGKTLSAQAAQPDGANDGANDALRREYAQKLDDARRLIDELRHDGHAAAGAGITPEGQGSVMSAPGTEAFKQDFADWDALRRQATTALDRAQAALSKALQEEQDADRLASGVEDRAPAGYQEQVDNYFKALAAKKKP
ncbi:MAG: hypothetical protein IT176_01475 [Acidobacteria bacterium]|nr:hypothetical protein [Acidobacteriota bacterium]